VNRWKAGWSGDPPTHGEADDLVVGVPDIVDGYGIDRNDRDDGGSSRWFRQSVATLLTR
jgi:hypothetical protein